MVKHRADCELRNKPHERFVSQKWLFSIVTLRLSLSRLNYYERSLRQKTIPPSVDPHITVFMLINLRHLSNGASMTRDSSFELDWITAGNGTMLVNGNRRCIGLGPSKFGHSKTLKYKRYFRVVFKILCTDIENRHIHRIYKKPSLIVNSYFYKSLYNEFLHKEIRSLSNVFKFERRVSW